MLKQKRQYRRREEIRNGRLDVRDAFRLAAEWADDDGRVNALELSQLGVQVSEVLIYLIKARQPLVVGTKAVAQLIGVLAQVGEHTLHRVGVSSVSALRLLHTVQSKQAGAGRLGNGTYVPG